MIPVSEHAERRRRVAAAIGADSALLLAAPPERIRNRDVAYPYRADSDMRWLTGFTEPEAVACLLPGRGDGEFVLFCRDRDPAREIWDGLRAGPEGAVTGYGADQAFALAEMDSELPKLLAERQRVYRGLTGGVGANDPVSRAIDKARSLNPKAPGCPNQIVGAEALLHDLRLRKSAAEIAMMRAAARVSAAAHCRAMRACRPGMAEYRLAAEIHHEFECAGMQWAYPSIVGGGANSCILHYIENTAILREGDLVLVDAGADNAGYAADITRTFPVGGRFSGPQRALYDLVLAAQRASIDAVRAGNPYDAFHATAVRVLTEGMIDLGLLEGERDDLIEQQAYRRFYMHGTGHWLGMDVHDVGAYRVDGEPRLLEPNMTLTVEPGLYVPPCAEGVDERFHGIGIRIEDDVRVTDGEPDVLTVDVPKEADEIEALMAEGSAR